MGSTNTSYLIENSSKGITRIKVYSQKNLAAKKMRNKTNRVLPEIKTIYQEQGINSPNKDTTIRETNEEIINFEDVSQSKASNRKSLEQEWLLSKY